MRAAETETEAETGTETLQVMQFRITKNESLWSVKCEV